MVFISILCRLSLVTFNIQKLSDGIYLKDFFNTFSQWVSFPFVDIILHEILPIEWTKFYSSWQYFIFHWPGQNFIIKFNEILSMDDISYEILSHGHYFRGQYFMIHKYWFCWKYQYIKKIPIVSYNIMTNDVTHYHQLIWTLLVFI